MPFVQGKCPNCGGFLAVDDTQYATVCPFCDKLFIVQKAINNYIITNNVNVGAGAVVNVIESERNDFVIENGTLKNYTGYWGDVVIPDSVISIGENAFCGCFGLTSITIPDSVTSIGSQAFYGCTGLTSITIPDNVTSIGFGVFFDCSELTSISVDKNNPVYHSADNCIIETKSKTLIAGCNNSVIPNDGSVTSIGDCAFGGCTGLTSVTIPDSVTSIDCDAFKDCTGLKSITIPNSVTNIGDSAFSFCSGLTSITIPDSVLSIGEFAFSYCTGLTSITIPDSVTSIGDYAFSGCHELTSISFDEDNPVYHSAGNCLIETESKTLIAGCNNSVIPDDGSVTRLGNGAFDGCTGFTSITIPNSVTRIGWNAFSGCTGLTSITIPYSVTSIGDYAFSKCTGLKDVYYAGNEIDRVNTNIFSNNDCLLNATWHYNSTNDLP